MPNKDYREYRDGELPRTVYQYAVHPPQELCGFNEIVEKVIAVAIEHGDARTLRDVSRIKFELEDHGSCCLSDGTVIQLCEEEDVD